MDSHVYWDGSKSSIFTPPSNQEVMAANAVRIAIQSGAKLIILISNTLDGVRYISKFRPNMPVMIITNDYRNAR